MENPTNKYIVLFNGCESEDVIFCHDFNDAKNEMEKMEEKVKKMGIYDKPYIMVYLRNENGDYLLHSLYGYTKPKIE